MQTEIVGNIEARSNTQLGVIRDVMLTAAMCGTWLTLAEIAESTEFGEASISAQLRHLRKPLHGQYRVEKRRRQIAERALANTPRFAEAPGTHGGCWEYLVLARQ
jgi:hypothetical protein